MVATAGPIAQDQCTSIIGQQNQKRNGHLGQNHELKPQQDIQVIRYKSTEPSVSLPIESCMMHVIVMK